MRRMRTWARDSFGLFPSGAGGPFFEPNLALRPRCYEIGFGDYPLAEWRSARVAAERPLPMRSFSITNIFFYGEGSRVSAQLEGFGV